MQADNELATGLSTAGSIGKAMLQDAVLITANYIHVIPSAMILSWCVSLQLVH
jgi:hypothetical protein